MPLTINGETIPQARLDQEAERLRPVYQQHLQQQGLPPNEADLKKWARQNVIEQTLLAQEASETIKSVSKKAVDRIYERTKQQFGNMPEKTARDLIVRHLKTQQLIKMITDQIEPVSEAEAKEYYDQHPGEFTGPEQVHAAHIVKHVKEETDNAAAYAAIRKIQSDLKAGKAFDELAIAHSDCPSKAGDLGFFGRGQMVQGFEDVVFGMEPGQISDVFRTEFGYHIARVFEKKPGEPIPFSEVKAELVKHFSEHRRHGAVQAFVDRLRKKAVIEDTEG